MLDQKRLLHLLKFAAPVVLIIWSLTLLTDSGTGYSAVLRTFKNPKNVFVADFLQHEVDGELDETGIANLCASKVWTPNLYLSCAPAPGGFGQVKNAHLTCIRFAIEMGAQLILPQVIKRHEVNLQQTTPNGGSGPVLSVPLDYLFDYEHLNRTLSSACPQMKLHRSLDDLYNVPSLLGGVEFDPGTLGAPSENGVMSSMTTLPGRIRDFVAQKWPKEKRSKPTRFHLKWSWFVWPTTSDKPAFARNFGRLLRVREDARRLAGSALFNMQQLFGLDLDPRHGIQQQKSFVGLHLRTEEDTNGEFPSYESQASYYLDYITRSKASVAFVATGASSNNVTAFAERAKDFNVTVVMKKDVLEGEDLALLDRLTWDQKALVDYEIMLRAGLVTGPSESSFIWNLALRRKNVYGDSKDTTKKQPNAHVQWQDNYSTVFGNSDRGDNMYKTIWP